MLPRNHLICIWYDLSAMFCYLLSTSQIPNTSFPSSVIPVDYVFYFSETRRSNRKSFHRPAGPSSICDTYSAFSSLLYKWLQLLSKAKPLCIRFCLLSSTQDSDSNNSSLSPCILLSLFLFLNNAFICKSY